MQLSAFGVRRARLAGAALLVTAAQACYEYRPVTTPTPLAGQKVALAITDQGRAGLSDRFGSGLTEIQGRILSDQGSDYVVSVYRVSRINGETASWSGEEARINRSFVESVKGRTFSPVRTTVAAVAGGAVLYFFVGQRLFGSFSGGHDPEPPPPPISNRIPFPLFRLRF
jgi:hypothetical protein